MTVQMFETLLGLDAIEGQLSITAYVSNARLVIAVNDRIGIRCRLIVPMDAAAPVVIETRGIAGARKGLAPGVATTGEAS